MGALSHPLTVRSRVCSRCWQIGQTPLHEVCFKGQLDCAKLLLDRGAVLEAKNIVRAAPRHPPSHRRSAAPTDGAIARVCSRCWQTGWTPLHLACGHGKLDCAKLLLDRGAVVDPKLNVRATPRRPPSPRRSAAPADGAIARVLSLLAGRRHGAPLCV